MTTSALLLELNELPTVRVAQFVAELARKNGISYQRTGLDSWAETVTRLSGDEVRLDATQNLLVALKRAGVLNGYQMSRLSVNHLRELKGVGGL